MTQINELAEKARLVAHSACCKLSPLHWCSVKRNSMRRKSLAQMSLLVKKRCMFAQEESFAQESALQKRLDNLESLAQMTLLVQKRPMPHPKLLGDGLPTPITPFSLIFTISSELSIILD